MIVEHRFACMSDLASALAGRLIDLTIQSAAAHPVGVLSGGGTPHALYSALARCNPDWSEVTLMLTDERCLLSTDEHSNAGQLNRQLLSQLQHPPKFIDVSLQPDWLSKESVLESEEIIWAVVGMGLDGHTASLFPDDINIAAHLQSTAVCVQVAAVGMPRTSRISLSPRFLNQARSLMMLIQGEAKWQVYQQAKADLSDSIAMPIRSLMNAQKMQVYWAP